MRHLLLKSLFFGILTWLPGGLHAQSNWSTTEVLKFSREDYGGGSQNWAIAEDDKQRIYVANNEGLLVFDGQRWQRFPVPNQTILRSIALDQQGRLFAGAQDELGYFAPDQHARLKFHSLKSLIPIAARSFQDVWQTVVTNDGVFFRSTKSIYRYHQNRIHVLPSRLGWLSLHAHHGRALAHEVSQGLLQWNQNQWQTYLPAAQLPEGFNLTNLVELGPDSSLVCSESHGLFTLSKRQLKPFKVKSELFNNFQHFTSLAILPDSSFLIGTYFNGIYRISRSGELLGNISNKNGLNNNTVRTVYANARQQVWIGLDNGIAFLDHDNAIRHLNPSLFNNGVGYGVHRLGNNLYFALSTGLLNMPLNGSSNLGNLNNNLQLLLRGLSWNIHTAGNRLLASRDDGIWDLTNEKPIPILRRSGFWTARNLPNAALGNANVVTGSYEGLFLFDTRSQAVQNLGAWPEFNESCRYLEVDGPFFWVSHPYRGVYQINRNNRQKKLFRAADGLPSNLNNHVFYIRKQILAATTQGVYEFNPNTNRFQPSTFYQRFLGNKPVQYLKEDAEGSVWLIQDKLPGVIDFHHEQPQLIVFPELANKMVSGFENIYPYNRQNVFFGSDEGFYHLNYERYVQDIRPFSAYLAQIHAIGDTDSSLFGGFPTGDLTQNLALPYDFNSIQFRFAATALNPHTRMEYSYVLDGFEKEWSDWSDKAEKDYTNLTEGRYTFILKARTGPGRESKVYQLSIRIHPPFYRTWWAYTIYSLAILGFLYGLLKFQARKYRKRQEDRRAADQQRFEEEQKQMAYQHQLDLEKTEKEFIRLQKEKLEAEINHKNAELATATMNLVQKKEFILKLKAELAQLQKGPQESSDTPELRKLLKTLGEEEKLNKEWDHFAQHFNSVHGNFLQILKSKFPLLKPHEMQLCAYLRMNLSSKDIAPLMSISVRGVEISRYRLRKKLNLSTEENLVQYLMDLKADN